jgi:DNA-binding transcriptional regulator YhcF (GntR family)
MTIREFAERPVYQQIAAKALDLSQLGLPFSRIAEALGVTPKTVAKAIHFLMQR